MPITLATLSDDDLGLMDAVTVNMGIRVGSFDANGIRKYYINNENVGYTLTYIEPEDFEHALDALMQAWENNFTKTEDDIQH